MFRLEEGARRFIAKQIATGGTSPCSPFIFNQGCGFGFKLIGSSPEEQFFPVLFSNQIKLKRYYYFLVSLIIEYCLERFGILVFGPNPILTAPDPSFYNIWIRIHSTVPRKESKGLTKHVVDLLKTFSSNMHAKSSAAV